MDYLDELRDELFETIENMNPQDIIGLRNDIASVYGNDIIYIPMEDFNNLVAGERSYVEVVNELDDDFDRFDEYFWQGQEETNYRYHSDSAEGIVGRIDIYELVQAIMEGFSDAREYKALHGWFDKLDEYNSNK